MGLLERYGEDLEMRGISPGTQKTYLIVLRQFRQYLGNKDMCSIGKPELKNWLIYLRKERGLKTATIELSFSIISGFYDYLLDEELIDSNPVPAFRKRNLRAYKKPDNGVRKIISVEEATRLVNSIVDSRDRAIILLLLKTGVRRHELAELDVSDVNLQDMSIILKPTPKRTNKTVFFDSETYEVLDWWLQARSRMTLHSSALFIGTGGIRLKAESIGRIVEEHATRAGLHDPASKRPEDRFTAHCCRHFFTTHLLRARMPREYVKELRGDARKEAIDIYNHIDKDDLRKSYLAHIPQLGI